MEEERSGAGFRLEQEKSGGGLRGEERHWSWKYFFFAYSGSKFDHVLYLTSKM